MSFASAPGLTDMTERHPTLAQLDALIGTWTTAAIHPLFGAVVPGSTTFEWLGGEHFLVQRSRNDHEMFPDSISIIGAPEAGDALVMEYFDSRGVRPTYGVSIEAGMLHIWRDDPCSHSASLPGSGTIASLAAGRSLTRAAPGRTI